MSDAEQRGDETDATGPNADAGSVAGELDVDAGGESDGTTVRATASAATWEAILEPLEALVSECRVRFGPSGVTLRATDPAKAALVAVTAEPAAFETYRASETTVGVDVDRLSEVVGLAGGETTVTVQPETRRLRVEAGGVAYETTVLEPDRVRDAPRRAELETEFDYGATFGVASGVFSRAVRGAEMVADHLVVQNAGEGVVRFEAAGDTDECTVRVPADRLTDPDLGPAESIISLDYLRLVERVLPDATVTVFAGEETPMAVEYEAAEAVDAEWLISPRIAR